MLRSERDGSVRAVQMLQNGLQNQEDVEESVFNNTTLMRAEPVVGSRVL